MTEGMWQVRIESGEVLSEHWNPLDAIHAQADHEEKTQLVLVNTKLWEILNKEEEEEERDQ